eukprot:6233339-Pyramimonas_sp.AAC.1
MRERTAQAAAKVQHVQEEASVAVQQATLWARTASGHAGGVKEGMREFGEDIANQKQAQISLIALQEYNP